MPVNPIDFIAEAEALFDYTRAMRRDFHAHPELGFKEVRTAGIVARELNQLGLEVTRRDAVDGDAVRRQLDGHRPGQHLQRALAGRASAARPGFHNPEKALAVPPLQIHPEWREIALLFPVAERAMGYRAGFPGAHQERLGSVAQRSEHARWLCGRGQPRNQRLVHEPPNSAGRGLPACH